MAENHRREIPECVLEAGLGEPDPDRRILKMLAARGKNLGKTEAAAIETSKVLAG